MYTDTPRTLLPPAEIAPARTTTKKPRAVKRMKWPPVEAEAVTQK